MDHRHNLLRHGLLLSRFSRVSELFRNDRHLFELIRFLESEVPLVIPEAISTCEGVLIELSFNDVLNCGSVRPLCLSFELQGIRFRIKGSGFNWRIVVGAAPMCRA